MFKAERWNLSFIEQKEFFLICLSCQEVDIYWVSLLIMFTKRSFMQLKKWPAVIGPPPQGSHGQFLLGWNDTNLDPDQLEQTFFFQYAHISLLRNLLPEQAPVKVFSVSCPSLPWINILLRNRFVMKICYLSFIFNEEKYA